MKFRQKEIDLPAMAPEPTIWALRKNPRANTEETAENNHSLYEHLFGYDPISLIRAKTPLTDDARATSAANPNLNIINPKTNFALMEIAAEMEPDESI